MKRQHDLIRKILAALWKHPSPWLAGVELSHGLQGVDADILDYHLVLCEQAGFVVANRKHNEDTRWQLTWLGHNQLDEYLGQK